MTQDPDQFAEQYAEEIVLFRQFDNAIDANIVKAKLDAYGIPCFLTQENLANLYSGAGSLASFTVRLHLFARDRERAQQLVDEQHLQVLDDSGLHCPRCQSRRIERDFPRSSSASAMTSLRILFFGIFVPHEKVNRCSDCDFEFTD